MSHILHRSLRQTLPLAATGHGVRIVDTAGKEYIDASGGAAVSCLGHGHPDVLRAMHEQIDSIAYAHTSFFSTTSYNAILLVSFSRSEAKMHQRPS